MANVGRILWTYLPLILLVGALLVGMTAVLRVSRETREEISPVSDEDLLAQFEQSYAAGDLDEAEFRRVKERLKRPQSPSPPTPKPPLPPEIAGQGGPSDPEPR